MSNSIDPNIAGAMAGQGTVAMPPARGVTPLSPVEFTREERHYTCTVKNASMHTPDGTKITFLNGYLRTNVRHIQEYLDDEIERGGTGPYLRHATQIEIDAAHRSADPETYYRDKVRGDMEKDLRAELEAKIRAELGLQPLVPTTMVNTPGAIEKVHLDVTDKGRVAGIDAVRQRIEAAKKSDGVNVIPTPAPGLNNPAVKTFQASIQSSADISDAAQSGVVE